MTYINTIDYIPTFHFCLDSKLEEHCNKTDLQSSNFLPTKNNPSDNCYDVRCAEPEGISLKPDQYFKISLGFRVICPEGWGLVCVSRSGMFINNHIHPLYGEIDCDFLGTMMFCAQYLPGHDEFVSSEHPKKINFGDRVAQIKPMKVQEMMIESITSEWFEKLAKEKSGSRGASGFGASGR